MILIACLGAYFLVAFVSLLPMYFSLDDAIPDKYDRALFSYLACAAWPVTLSVVAGAFVLVLFESRTK